MSTATQVWKKWQGQTVDGKFPLLRELGGSDESVVFITERVGREPRHAAIKLMPAAGRDEGAELARWSAAGRLDHPHLMRIFECGRCELDGQHYLYVVMDYAEEGLSQILPQRPLTPEEAADVLQPTAEALSYLHQAGFVHGRLKPSNILAVDNQLKVSADGLFAHGEHLQARRLAVYDAPEVLSMGLSPAADIWSLGVTLIATLTQYPPDFTNVNPPQAIVPENVPQPFRGIASACLRTEPGQRCSLDEILMRLQSVGPAAQGEGLPAEEPETSSRPRWVLPAVIVIALVLAGFGLRQFLARHPSVPAAEQPAQPAPEATAKPSPPPFAAKPASSQGKIHGHVLQQVVPTVPASARNTITGKIKVNVQVAVDSSGKVSGARLALRGPSAYFARLAEQSARQWSFTPAQVDGQPVASEWMLRFQFTRSGAQVAPAELRP